MFSILNIASLKFHCWILDLKKLRDISESHQELKRKLEQRVVLRAFDCFFSATQGK